MGINPGIGGSVGGYPTPSVEEFKNTAAEVTKAVNLGIVPPEMYDMLPISEMGRTMVWKYTSDCTKPLMPMVRRLPVAMGSIPEKSEARNEQIAYLIGLLPPDVRARYEEELKLPAEQRNSAYQDLQNLIEGWSDVLVWVQTAEARLSGGTPIEELAIFHQELIQQGAGFGQEITKAVEGYLNAVGHQDPNFDLLSGWMERLQTGVGSLQGGNPQDQARIAGELSQWNADLAERAIGDNLQMLRPALNLVTLLALGASLGKGLPTLLFGLDTASIGLDDSSSATALMPNTLGSVKELLTQAFGEGVLSAGNKGASTYMSHLLTALLFSGAALGSLGAAKMSPLLLELHLLTGMESGILDGICSALAAACGAPENRAEVAAQMLAIPALLVLIEGAAKDDARAAALVELLSPLLGEGIAVLEEYVSATVQEGGGNASIVPALNVGLQQGRVALEERDSAVFWDVAKELEEASVTETGGSNETAESSKRLDEFVNKSLWQNVIANEEEATLHANIGVLQGQF